MIIYESKEWGVLFKTIGRTFKESYNQQQLLKFVGIVTVYATLITIFNMHWLNGKLTMDSMFFSMLGFVLSMFLVFRLNSAYDRWWEGRKKWGELVNNSRNLAIKISALTDDAQTKQYFSRMIANYAISMKEHLREGVITNELDLTKDEQKEIANYEHKPNYIISMLYKKLDELKKKGQLTEENYIVLDINLKSFSDIIGACERIKNTPIPYSYSMFFKKFIFIYVTTLPLAFVHSFGYYSSLVSIFVFYVLVSLEILAEEIEDPFGTDDNDLPTDSLSEKIKGNVQEILS